AGFADHLEVGLGADEIRQPAAHDLVVVDEKDIDHSGSSFRGVVELGRGTRQTARVPSPGDSIVNVPPRRCALWVRLSSPLRRGVSRMPMPSSSTVTATVPPSAASSIEILSARA